MFRRNADPIQGAGHAVVEGLLDLVELNFNATLERADLRGRVIDLGVGREEFFADGFFAFLSTV